MWPAEPLYSSLQNQNSGGGVKSDPGPPTRAQEYDLVRFRTDKGVVDV